MRDTKWNREFEGFYEFVLEVMPFNHHEIFYGQCSNLEGQTGTNCVKFKEVRPEVVFYSTGLISYRSVITLIFFDFEKDTIRVAVPDFELDKLDSVDIC